MTDRLPKTELELLQEEVKRLAARVEELEAGEPPMSNGRPGLWVRLFGRLVYEGPKTCDQCRFWTQPYIYYSKRDLTPRHFGDCRLLSGRKNTPCNYSCKSFEARRRFKRRVRA